MQVGPVYNSMPEDPALFQAEGGEKRALRSYFVRALVLFFYVVGGGII